MNTVTFLSAIKLSLFIGNIQNITSTKILESKPNQALINNHEALINLPTQYASDKTYCLIILSLLLCIGLIVNTKFNRVDFENNDNIVQIVKEAMEGERQVIIKSLLEQEANVVFITGQVQELTEVVYKLMNICSCFQDIWCW